MDAYNILSMYAICGSVEVLRCGFVEGCAGIVVYDYRNKSGACPRIRKGVGLNIYFILFFLCFSSFQGGGPAQKIAEKMIFSTKKVAKYR